MHRVLSREQIRSFDQIAIKQCNVPGVVLMENAGRGAAEVIRTLVTNEMDHVLIVCGTGNNGGDGLVVARHLSSFDISVSVCLLGNPTKLKGDARTNYNAFMGIGGQVAVVADEDSMPVLETELQGADLVVDAIFGTGLDREVQGRFALAIDGMNAALATRVALDIPSGLDANTGMVLGTAVVADTTITFGALKLGLMTPMGGRLCGEIHLAGLGVSTSIIEQTGHEAEVLIGSRIQAMVERIRDQAALLQQGTVGIFASRPSDAWAARLAARAALRTSPNEVRLIGTSEALEPLEDLATDVSLTPRASKHLAKGFAKVWAGCDSLVFPAASASDMPAIRQATKNFEGAIILGTAPSFGPKAKQLGSNGGDVAVVCCPESLGVSLGTDADSVQSDRFGAVRAFSGMAEATVVLADSQPMVALPATALGVLGKSVESFHSRGVRAATCGVMGAVACWTETSIAALAGIHLMVQAMDAWAEKNKGRSAPLAMEVADSITWMAH